MDQYRYIKENIEKVMARIHNAAEAAGRDPSEIKLLLATKTRSVEEINYALSLGYGLIGENRAQELVEKAPHLSNSLNNEIMPRETHFIGTLQGNKVNEVTQIADTIQTVDRIRIARRIHNYALKNHLKRSILIQVNCSGEESKQGLAPDELLPFLKELTPFTTLTVRGLMTIGLNSDNPDAVRKGFALLRQLKEKAQAEGLLSADANELSMGMSGDLELAIAEGATIIRVGSDIFGPRDY